MIADIEMQLIKIKATGLLRRFIVLLKLRRSIPMKLAPNNGVIGINQVVSIGEGMLPV